MCSSHLILINHLQKKISNAECFKTVILITKTYKSSLRLMVYQREHKFVMLLQSYL
jgi:hypothetical protein